MSADAGVPAKADELRFPEEGIVLGGRYVVRSPVPWAEADRATWQADDLRLGYPVQLWFLPESVVWHAGALELVKREVRRVVRLRHPGLVRVHDLVMGPGLAAIVTEPAAGSPLGCRPPGPLDRAALAAIWQDLCGALEHAHGEGGVLHRALAPDQVFVSSVNRARIAGFGIVAGVSEAMILAGDSVPERARRYASPQCRGGERPTVDDDLYSLGAITAELVGGLQPNAEAEPAEARILRLRRCLEEAGESSVVAARWATAIGACLAPEREDRPESVAELRRLVERGTVARRPSQPRSEAAATPEQSGWGGWDWPWRNAGWPTGPMLGLLALAAICAGTAIMGHIYQVSRTSRKAAAPKPVPPALRVRQWAERLVATEPRGRGADISSVQRGFPELQRPWQIEDLGMRFAPVPGMAVLLSIWETRVRDFAAFVAATGHETEGLSAAPMRDWESLPLSWCRTGYPLGRNHPVGWVSEGDARAFCAWLTARERAAGRLGANQEYRLPTDEEWTAAAGPAAYPWGDAWPPADAGENLADESARIGPNSLSVVVPRYDDGFVGPAPVGAGVANRNGFFDLGGNVQERVAGRRGGIRGGDFRTGNAEEFRTLVRTNCDESRVDIGFRVACAPVGSTGRAALGCRADNAREDGPTPSP